MREIKMAGKCSERFPTYNDLRLQRRISHSFAEIVDRLEAAPSDERKIVHLQKLLQIDLTEILPVQLKSKLFDVIQQDLNNFNSDVFELSFNLHLKLMKSVPTEYSCLCLKSAVVTLISLADLQQNKPKIDVDDPVLSRLFYLSKFALQIFGFVSDNISGFSDENLLEMCDHFVTLMSKQIKYDNALTPFDAVCNIDQDSKWSKNMVHSQRPRLIFLNCLQNRPELLKQLLTIVKDWYHSPTIPILTDEFSILNRETIKFYNFISSFCTIVNICKFQSSFQMFPVVIDEKPFDVIFTLKMTFEFFKQSKYMHYIPPNVINFTAKTLGAIFNNSLCVNRTLLDYMFQDIHLWVSPLVVLLAAVVRHESSASIFLQELGNRAVNEAGVEEVNESIKSHANNLAKYVCKLIAYAMNNIMRDEEYDANFGANLLSIFDNVFSNNYFCHILMQEDPKLIPHLMHFCHNPKYANENDRKQQIMVLRCLQRVLTVIAFSPHCLTMLEESYSVQEIMSLANARDIKGNYYWKLTFFMFTTLLPRSEIYRSERNVMVKKCLNYFTILLETETLYDIDDEERELLNFIFTFTHDIHGLIAVLEVSDTESEETVTDSLEDYPLSMTDFLIMTLQSDTFESRFQLTGVKILRNMISSLDCSLFLQNHLNFRKIEDYFHLLDPDDSTELFQVMEDIFGALYINSCESDESDDNILSLDQLTQLLLEDEMNNERLTDMIVGASDIKFEENALEQFLSNLVTKSSSPPSEMKFDLTDLENVELCPEEMIGIELTIRYGNVNKTLENISNNMVDLQILQQSAKKALECKIDGFLGYNWFVATSFLLNEGHLERTENCLNLLVQLEISNYLWLKFPKSFTEWAFLDYIISKELPSLCFAFQNYGICSWVLCQKWTRECFWPILCWSEIKKLFLFLLLHTSDYLFYFYLTFLRTNEKGILESFQKGNYLLTPTKFNYKLSEHISDLEFLNQKYSCFAQEIMRSS